MKKCTPYNLIRMKLFMILDCKVIFLYHQLVIPIQKNFFDLILISGIYNKNESID